jgi:polar amino acid transport system substrate-binding protein
MKQMKSIGKIHTMISWCRKQTGILSGRHRQEENHSVKIRHTNLKQKNNRRKTRKNIMKKLASILAVTLAAGVLATGSASKDSSSDSGKTVIKAATGANAKPYVYVGDDDKPAGYDVDILNAVFNKLPDYELEYEVTDFGSVLSGLNSGNYQIGVNNFSYNEDRGASYLYSYPYDKISYVFVTKKGGKEIKSFEDAAGLSFEGGTGISVSNAIEAWNEKNPDKAINITYSDADTSVFLQHVADGSQDFTIIDLAMYNSYMEEFNYDVQKNDIPEDEAKMIAENSYAYYIFPQDQKDLREQVDKVLKELKEDGTLTEISKKWYGQDAAPEDDKFEETIN